jgi:2-iminobutanoate/2-iminopropanoate deaminase
MSPCKCREIITVEKGPKAIGPYSVGVKACKFVYTAGQIGIDPATGELVKDGLEAETRQALENLRAILESGGSNLAHVIKTTVFLKNIADFAKMNAIYAEYFTSEPPARSAFQVAALPKGAQVEIESVALVHDEECGCDDDCGCSEEKTCNCH